MILDKTRTNARWDNMMGNNNEWKENFRLSQPTPMLLFWRHFVSRCEATNSLLTISS